MTEHRLIELDQVHKCLHPLRLGRSLGRACGHCRERPEQAVRLAEKPPSEVHGVGSAAVPAIADLKRPQPVDPDRLAIAVLHPPKRTSDAPSKDVDYPSTPLPPHNPRRPTPPH